MTVSLPATAPSEAGIRTRESDARPGRGSPARGRLAPLAIASAGLLAAFALLVALAPLAGWHVVRLATGSMAPSLPADSLLLVRDVDARELEVGQVATVAQPGQLPVTHRVLSVRSEGGSAVLELKGDANAMPDPQPYRVATAGLVVGGLPWGGQVVEAVRAPWVAGVLTVLVAALVVRAWWPRGARRPAHRRA